MEIENENFLLSNLLQFLTIEIKGERDRYFRQKSRKVVAENFQYTIIFLSQVAFNTGLWAHCQLSDT